MFYLFFSLSTASAVKTFLHYIPTQLRILQGFTYGEILTINTSSQKSQPLTLFFFSSTNISTVYWPKYMDRKLLRAALTELDSRKEENRLHKAAKKPQTSTC